MPPIPFLPWGFDLSDPGAKGALYDSQATGRLVGIDLGWGPVLDEGPRRRPSGTPATPISEDPASQDPSPTPAVAMAHLA